MNNSSLPFKPAFGVLLASSVFVITSLSIDGSQHSMMTALCCSIGLLIVSKFAARHYQLYALIIILVCGATVLVVLRHQHIRFNQQIPAKEVELTGTISSIPIKRGESTRFEFAVDKSLGDVFSGRVRINWFEATDLHAGQYWKLIVRLKEPHGFASSGAFDYEALLARENIQAVGYVRSGTYLGENTAFLFVLHRLRERLKEWLVLELSEEISGVFSALLLGDKSGISPSLWDWYNQTGTTHLLVISGLHIGLMAWLGCHLATLFGVLGGLPLKSIPLPWIKSFFGIGLAFGYATLAGFSIPVQRALVMTVVALISFCFGLRVSVLSAWAFALFTVLIVDPLAFTSAGFWYSFIAVAALCIGLSGRVGMKLWIQRVIKPQWLVFVVLLPLLLSNGQPVSLLSPLINLIAIPFMGIIIVPLLLFSGGLYFINSHLASYIIHALGKVLESFHQLLEILTQWNFLLEPRQTVTTTG
ncbi:MAG: ComEC/Rec2 family competence protein, partial [Endozoicomonas sp.]